MRRSSLFLLAALAIGSMAFAPVATTTSDGGSVYPVGTCVHVPSVYAEPLCVLVDPTE